jgi:hypothetical protein
VILRTSNSGGPALVVPIEAAAFSDLDHRALLAALDRARLRAVHVEPLVTAPAMVVLEVRAEDTMELSLVQHHDVVQTLATNAAYEPLDVG